MMRSLLGTGALLGAAPFTAAHVGSHSPSKSKMKITAMDTIMTGRDVYVRLETDVGIVGYRNDRPGDETGQHHHRHDEQGGP